jgi:hypothetical protein
MNLFITLRENVNKSRTSANNVSLTGDKVTNIVTDVNAKSVVVTSTLTSDELLAILQKTGKKIEFRGEK